MHKCKCIGAGHCFWHHAIVDNQQYEACQQGTPPQQDTVPCVYLGKHKREKTYECLLHRETELRHDDERPGILTCEDCKDFAKFRRMPKKWIDPLRVTDRDRQDTHVLRNMLSGTDAFLVCGGPSVNSVDFEALADRGIFSLGVNNVAAYVPVSAFVCSDPPSKFWNGIFEDPCMMKFLPIPKLSGNRAKLRKRLDDGFVHLEKKSNECPNVWGFERRSWLMPDDTWFLTRGAAWGNHQKGVDKTGEEKSVCTMLLGLRLLQYLGAKRIFLLGCDFHMDPSRELHANYAFGEERDKGACHSNNNIYRVVNQWLIKLRPIFEKYGFETYNTCRNSGLRAFGYVPLEHGLEICRTVPKEKPNLAGWYKK